MVSRYAFIRAWPFTHRRAFAHGMESFFEACPCKAGFHVVGAGGGHTLLCAAVARGASLPTFDLAICSQQRLYGSALLFSADRSLSVWRFLAGLSDGTRSGPGLTSALGHAFPG